jgi:predicted GTPase
MKAGDGTTAWATLPYLPIPDGSVTTAKIGDAQVTTAKIGDAQVTTAKFAPTASTTFIGGKRVIVQTTTPTAPAGGFGVGDVWISY